MTSDSLPSTRPSPLGLTLFALYSLCYGGFVGLSAFASATMEIVVFAGLNLAVVYGFGLIVLAMLLSLIYGYVGRQR